MSNVQSAVNARLDELAATIRRLRAAIVEDERAASDLSALATLERVTTTRAQLEAALFEYFTLAEASRANAQKGSEPPR